MSNLSDPKMIDNWVRLLGSMIERGEALHDLFPIKEVNAYSTAQFDAIASKLGLTKSMVMLAHKAAPQQGRTTWIAKFLAVLEGLFGSKGQT